MSSQPLTRSRLRFALPVLLALAAACVALAVASSDRGDAAYPGLNGRIAYAAGDNYDTSIWSVNPDGTAPTRLTAGTGDWGPAYSADGARIAFSRDSGIFAMNADGSGLVQLASGFRSEPPVETEWVSEYEGRGGVEVPWVRIQKFQESWHYFNGPSFSPDGTQLAVVESSGTWNSTSICAVVDDGDEECIGYGDDGDPYFDYESECKDCSGQIITISSTTGARLADVTPRSSSNQDTGPSYAPDGRIAFTRTDANSFDSSIQVVAAPGAAPVPLTSGPNDRDPEFSPDGTRIVFERGSRELGLVGAGGGPISILTVPLPPGASRSYVSDPAFSPDGTRLAFQHRATGSGGTVVLSGLYTMGLDGAGLTRIADGGFSPSWQSVAPPPPPVPASSKTKKGKVKLSKKGKGVIGTIVCGSSPCTLKGTSATLKVKAPKPKKPKKAGKSDAQVSKKKGGKKPKKPKTSFSVGLSVPTTLPPGGQGAVTVNVKGKALAALTAAGKGTVTAKVKVTEAAGGKVVTLKSVVVPPKQKGKKGAGKKGKGGK